eukprot:EG_transcript_16019
MVGQDARKIAKYTTHSTSLANARRQSIRVSNSMTSAMLAENRPDMDTGGIQHLHFNDWSFAVPVSLMVISAVAYFCQFSTKDRSSILVASGTKEDWDGGTAEVPPQEKDLPAEVADDLVSVAPAQSASTVTAAEMKVGWWLRFGVGHVGCWCQFWLSAISSIVAVFAWQYMYSPTNALFGLGFTVLSNLASWASVLWALRCRHVGKVLRREVPSTSTPTKRAVIRLLWTGVLLNVQGLLASIIGVEACAGLLLAQSLTAGPTVMVPGFSRGVAAFDVFAQLSQAQSLLSLILGVALALHTLRIATQPFSPKVG